MYLKKWILKENQFNEPDLQDFSKIIRMILKNRGFRNKNDVDGFIGGNGYVDPFKLKDMKKAVERIKFAIENDEKIIIYGDYDVDGITSTVILFLYLSDLGANVDYYIPSRDKEGYGLNIKAIDKISEDFNLIITVDNGITAVDEIEYANNRGVDVVVTDHHKPLEIIPNAIAVVDPHREDCDSGCEVLAGVGVVFKLLCALEGNEKKILDRYADIIGLGTIGDIVSLTKENRLIVKECFKKIKSNPNIGLKALIDLSKVDVNNISTTIFAFRIVPRINSASRMGKINLSVDLLLSEDYNEAMKIAEKLDETNTYRKKTEMKIYEEINQMILEDPELVSSKIIVLSKEGWNHSIIGINASKLVEKYNKPCILISIDGETANASGRGIDGVSLIDAIDYCKEYLIKYGGHAGAAGLTLKTENIDKFSSKIKEYMEDVSEEINVKTYQIDCEVKSEDITINNINDIKLLEPYGIGNEEPLILIRQARIISVISLAKGKYVKILVDFYDNSRLEVLIFDICYDDFIYKAGDIIDLIVTLDLNLYNNIVSPMLLMKDIRPFGFHQDIYFNEMNEYNKFKKLKNFNKEIIKNNIPDRLQLGIIYKYLKEIKDFTYTSVNDLIEYLFIKLNKYNLGYVKIVLALDILRDIKVVSLDNKIEILDVKDKADINNSDFYKNLKLLLID